MEEKVVKLESLGHGAAAELFERELERVLENIADPNCKAEAERQVRLVVKMKPIESRDAVAVSIVVDSKLAGPKAHATTVYVGRKAGRMIATEYNPRQMQLKWDEESKPREVRPGTGRHEPGADTVAEEEGAD